MKRNRIRAKELEKRDLIGDIDDDQVDIDIVGFSYALSFRNASPVELEGMKAECHFIYTERATRHNSVGAQSQEDPVQKQQEESIHVSLRAEGRCKQDTRPFILQSWDLRSGYYFSGSQPEKLSARPEGLWVRVFYTTPDGEKLRRDFYESKSVQEKIR